MLASFEFPIDIDGPDAAAAGSLGPAASPFAGPGLPDPEGTQRQAAGWDGYTTVQAPVINAARDRTDLFMDGGEPPDQAAGATPGRTDAEVHRQPTAADESGVSDHDGHDGDGAGDGGDSGEGADEDPDAPQGGEGAAAREVLAELTSIVGKVGNLMTIGEDSKVVNGLGITGLQDVEVDPGLVIGSRSKGEAVIPVQIGDGSERPVPVRTEITVYDKDDGDTINQRIMQSSPWYSPQGLPRARLTAGLDVPVIPGVKPETGARVTIGVFQGGDGKLVAEAQVTAWPRVSATAIRCTQAALERMGVQHRHLPEIMRTDPGYGYNGMTIRLNTWKLEKLRDFLQAYLPTQE